MQTTDSLGPDARYARFLSDGRFMIQRSRTTGRYFFYPRVAEPSSGDTDLEWVEASGCGTVYSTTVVRKKSDRDSYNVALIDLAEGPRMMSRVIGIDPAEVCIGMIVEAFIEQEPDQHVVVFRPARERG